MGLPLVFSMVGTFQRTIRKLTYHSAYGGIGGSLFPFFSPSFLTFLHLYGGVLAVPIIRGGLEFGSAWRDAGNTRNKLNSIQDFITATYARLS
jgi:prolyl oligopeptidase PreP (S9A serine peptidase family)